MDTGGGRREVREIAQPASEHAGLRGPVGTLPGRAGPALTAGTLRLAVCRPESSQRVRGVLLSLKKEWDLEPRNILKPVHMAF